jgi:hypothetical protein
MALAVGKKMVSQHENLQVNPMQLFSWIWFVA